MKPFRPSGYTPGVSTDAPRFRVLFAFFLTLVLIHLVPNRLLLLPLLLVNWAAWLWPLGRRDVVLFAIAAIFFLFQNHAALVTGIFEFRDKDLWLMPYYEPLLWGFYFTCMGKLAGLGPGETPPFQWTNVLGLAVTSVVFSVFPADGHRLTIASLCSTALLLALFHTRRDWTYAGTALVMGAIVEVFGVWTGIWWYPAPDVLGIPWWFATMWVSAGVLGYRFLVPVSTWVAARLAPQRA